MERANNPFMAAQRETLHREMLQAWQNKLSAAGDDFLTITNAISPIEQMVTLTGKYAWEWSRADADRYGASQRLRCKRSALRHKQKAVRNFLTFLCEDGRDWQQRCNVLFGTGIAQVFYPDNMVPHVGSEMDPSQRPFTTDELRLMIRYFIDRIERLQSSRRKGLLTTARDYTVFAVALMYGIRDNESAHLEDFDFSPSPDERTRETYGRFGVLSVRCGKAKRRGSKRRRQVLTVPEFAFLLPTLQWYLHEVRPKFPSTPGCEHRLFVTEHGGPMHTGNLCGEFRRHRTRAGLSKDLSLHNLRHTYITRLLEWDYPELFVQTQAGHADASSTATYTSVGDSFRQQCIREAMERLLK